MAVNGINGVHGVHGVHDINGEIKESAELWRHPHPETTELYAFQQYVAKKHGIQPSTYQDLWQWSVDHPDTFWEDVWHYTGIKAHKQYNVGKESAGMKRTDLC
jgi:acetoacetyl-CoA synthetase